MSTEQEKELARLLKREESTRERISFCLERMRMEQHRQNGTEYTAPDPDESLESMLANLLFNTGMLQGRIWKLESDLKAKGPT